MAIVIHVAHLVAAEAVLVHLARIRRILHPVLAVVTGVALVAVAAFGSRVVRSKPALPVAAAYCAMLISSAWTL